jgi:carbon storage regulator CsrA
MPSIEKGVSIMLVLTRKNHESVVVGDTNFRDQLLKVTVLEIRRGKVTLGIEGDRNVPVYRCEIWENFRAEGICNRSAGNPRGDRSKKVVLAK